MAYLGRGIENLSDRVVLDSLTASATASYTLQLNSVNFVPSSAESLTVSLNGVIQAPISSYTVSGSTLTFASALTSSDSIDFIIAERGITLQTPSAGSVGTSQLATNSISTIKIQDDAVTKDKVSNLMYPAFEAYMSSIQESVVDNTYTKAQIDTEVFDTDNCYDNSTNYRFTPTVAGKYFVYAFISFFCTANDAIFYANTAIYKNGTRITSPRTNYGGGSVNAHAPTQWVYSVLDLNGSTDYVEIYGQADCSTGNIRFLSDNHTESTRFGAYRIIGA